MNIVEIFLTERLGSILIIFALCTFKISIKTDTRKNNFIVSFLIYIYKSNVTNERVCFVHVLFEIGLRHKRVFVKVQCKIFVYQNVFSLPSNLRDIHTQSVIH